jgi:competence protein ComEC
MRIKLLPVFVLIVTLLLVSKTQAQMKAHFINVGQADSILLEFKTAAILIDAGGENTGDDRDKDHLLEYLNKFFDKRTDLNRTLYSIIISHPHIDHTKSIPTVMQNFTVKNFVDGGGESGSGISQNHEARQIAETKGIIYNRVPDIRIGTGGYTTPLLKALLSSPSEVDIRFLAGFRNCKNENNDTLTVLVRYKGTAMLFSGDAESESAPDCVSEISHLLKRFKRTSLLNIDLYKVGHHGSHNGTSPDYLRRMTPKISIISAGNKETQSPGNFHAFQFGHPREKAVKIIEDATTLRRKSSKIVYTMTAVQEILPNRSMEKAVYCTCWDGDIVVGINKNGRMLPIKTTN